MLGFTKELFPLGSQWTSLLLLQHAKAQHSGTVGQRKGEQVLLCKFHIHTDLSIPQTALPAQRQMPSSGASACLREFPAPDKQIFTLFSANVHGVSSPVAIFCRIWNCRCYNITSALHQRRRKEAHMKLREPC